jgi:hypothetical protein
MITSWWRQLMHYTTFIVTKTWLTPSPLMNLSKKIFEAFIRSYIFFAIQSLFRNLCYFLNWTLPWSWTSLSREGDLRLVHSEIHKQLAVGLKKSHVSYIWNNKPHPLLTAAHTVPSLFPLLLSNETSLTAVFILKLTIVLKILEKF